MDWLGSFCSIPYTLIGLLLLYTNPVVSKYLVSELDHIRIMKKTKVSYTRHAVLAFISMVLLTYILAWDDLNSNDQLTGDLGEDISKSFDYWIGWLPTWWLLIIIGTFVFSLVSYGITFGVKKLLAKRE